MLPELSVLELSVLGPVTATRDGEPLDLGGPRQRAVLAALIAASPRMIPAEQILAEVWSSGVPSTGKPPSMGSLHAYVSQLRAVLETDRSRAPEILVRSGPGYALLVPPDTVDAGRFARLVARGREALAGGDPVAAADALVPALDLWRGPAYADVPDRDFLEPEITRLATLRLAAAEDLFDAHLRAGRAAEVVEAAQAHTARHPLRERGWELLVLALYRSGRQADALAALRTVRGLLADELGVDPGPALAALERWVLAQDPRLIDPGRTGTGSPGPGGADRGDADPDRSTARAQRSVLPVALTDLVGREKDAGAVAALLAGSRLVTLTGPGGVGKTRLGLEVAGRLPEADGPWLVELASLQDPSLLAATVADELGIPGVADAARLASVLGERTTVIVLDNCEHLADGVARLVAHLLARCAGLRVLATSRETLEVAGERVCEVAPLGPGDALELFARRARAAVPGWEPDETDRAAVRRIVDELDGVPLALELAAARMRMLSAAEVADGLADRHDPGRFDPRRFDLLRGGPREAPERHRGLAEAVEWSHRSLGPPEKALFGRIAAFASSFDLSAAAAVAGTGTSPLAPLGELVRRSLVAAVPGTTPRRFRLLATLRQFALLVATDEERAAALAAHRAYVLGRVTAAERRLRGPEGGAVLAELRRDRAEHRAALASAEAAGDAPTALGLVGRLGWFWYRDGHIAEGIGFARRALDLPVTAADPELQRLRGTARYALGLLSYLAGDAVGSLEALALAQEAGRAADDLPLVAESMLARGHVGSLVAPGPEPARLAREGLRLARETGLPWLVAEGLMITGMVGRLAGEGGRARDDLAEAVLVSGDCGYGWVVVSASWALMKAHVDAGEPAAALAVVPRMQAVLDADEDVTSWLVVLHTSAAVLAGTGRAEEGAALLGAVSAHGARIGFSPELMDPVDGPREAAAVRSALPSATFERAFARGAELDRAGANALLMAAVGRRSVSS
ncbi:MAG: winged helix-turn-helix domain-containing protein [Pseudonocardia sp.]|nr:winged helix-turn-helix domain-containing protein [Pseudonocardia sp.]